MADDPLLAYCRDAIHRGSRSFARASALFARETRQRAHLLYAWCRFCDDEIDVQRGGQPAEHAGTGSARERLDRVRVRTAAALRGGDAGGEPAFLALRRVVERSAIPEHHVFELLEGFQWDADQRHCASLDDLLAYCYHVAGCVGVMMAYAMGVDDADTLDRAADLGIAFQLTNIARDVRDDARAGRVYLPLDWLAEAGVRPAEIGTPPAAPRLVPLVRRLLDTADAYYDSAAAGLRRLPFRSAWAVAAALAIYRDIGREVRARGAAAWDGRAVVSRGRKAYDVAAALFRVLGSRTARSGRVTAPRVGLWTRNAAGARSGPG